MTLTRAFDRLALPWSLSILLGVGMGIGSFLSIIDQEFWALILYAIILIYFVLSTSRLPINSSDNWDHREIYSSDKSWLPLAVILVWSSISTWLGSSIMIGLIAALFVSIFFTLLNRYSHRLVAHNGRKHAREVLEKEIEVSEEQIKASQQHRELLSTLYTLGAVEGVRVRTRLVAHALNTNATMVLRTAREPQAAGLLYTSAVDAGNDEEKIFMALTAEGVHALSRATQATPQRA